MTIAMETQRFPDRQYYSENRHERTSVAKSAVEALWLRYS